VSDKAAVNIAGRGRQIGGEAKKPCTTRVRQALCAAHAWNKIASIGVIYSTKRERERSIVVADNRQAEHERIGSIAGLGAGVIAGAQVGTIFIPIPIIGTFTGALIGGVLGSEIGKNVGAALLDGVAAFADSLSGQQQTSDEGGTPPTEPSG
jgi:outer membrane lipoprotein SlyB